MKLGLYSSNDNHDVLSRKEDVGDSPEARRKNEVRSIQKALTERVDINLDLDVQMYELQAKLQKKSRAALDFVLWDLQTTNAVKDVGNDASQGNRLTKASIAELMIAWVSFS